ncbi:MAG: acyl-ACP--UDP-N-acetylglucosamine O-acyltransferase [Planctomycetota bacterium]|nr:MAG: acyl-ACP--UDP-N-acetylglucosamine O-acyltransferase [Planctomycetota bacterium]
MAETIGETAVHPTAVVHPGAELGTGVEVGPFCVLEPGVVVGDGCRLAANVHLLGRTFLGPGCVVGSHTVLGGEPQDQGYQGEASEVHIGARCRFYEHVTVHRATGEGKKTVLGDGVMMMTGSHVGHNSVVEDHAILVNHSSVGGHGFVGSRAFMSACSAVHQFGKVGRMTLVGGACMLTQDAPPFSIVVGAYPPVWRGPNAVGLRRAGMSAEERDAVRKALHKLFRSSESPVRVAQELRDHPLPAVTELACFVLESKRGVCAASSGRKPASTASKLQSEE